MSRHSKESGGIEADISKQVNSYRQAERAPNQFETVDRDGNQYDRLLRGLDEFVKQVAQIKSRTIVDVGAGKCVGVSDLAQRFQQLGLIWEATGLYDYPDRRKFGVSRFTLTSAEEMSGYGESSVAGIIAVYSTHWCIHPEVVVSRFDQILEPGGIIRMRMDPKKGDEYRDQFIKLGYRVELLNMPYTRGVDGGFVSVFKPDVV